MVAPQDTVGYAERLLRIWQLELETRPRTPAWWSMVQHDFAALRALAPAAPETRLWAQWDLTEYAQRKDNLPWALASMDTLRQMIRALPDAVRRKKESVFSTYTVVQGINNKLMLSMCFSSTNVFFAPQFKTAFEQELAQARQDVQLVDLRPESRNYYLNALTFTLHQYMYDSAGGWLHSHPAQSLVAQRWFHRPDSTVTYPRPGVPTVVVRLNSDKDCIESCAARYAKIRRLYTEFAPKGVDFILFTNTRGYIGLSNMLPLAAEIDSLRSLYLDSLKLPGILAIEETQFQTLDGLRQPKPFATANADVYAGDFYVVDRNGMVWSSMFQQDEKVLEDTGYQKLRMFLTYSILPYPLPSAPSASSLMNRLPCRYLACSAATPPRARRRWRRESAVLALLAVGRVACPGYGLRQCPASAHGACVASPRCIGSDDAVGDADLQQHGRHAHGRRRGDGNWATPCGRTEIPRFSVLLWRPTRGHMTP